MCEYDNMPKLVIEFLNFLRGKKKSIKTINGYREDLDLFFKFVVDLKYGLNSKDFSDINIKDMVDLDFIKSIEFTDLQAYTVYLMDVRKNGTNTIQRRQSGIRSFFNYLETTIEVIKKNPSRKLESPKEEERDPIYLTKEESKILMESTKIEKRNSVRDDCIITLFLNTGMRLSELVGINLSDITDDLVKTIGKGNKQNKHYLNKECLKALEKYLEIRPTENIKKGDEDALFLSERKQRMGTASVGLVVKKYASLSGVNKNKKITAHKLRHSFASSMIEKGVDILVIKELLNHKNVATTQIYTHLNDDKLREAVNRK